MSSLAGQLRRDVPTVGSPASPLSVRCSDVNRDYVFLTWSPPSADGAGPVLGYYVEKFDMSVGRWARCPGVQRACCAPVTGLKDGGMYQFRVLALNQAGVGRPSKATDPVLLSDPAEPGRTMVVKLDRGKEIIITKDQLEGEIRVPLPPTDVHASEVRDTYAVVSWSEPDPRGREKLTFYVEQTLCGKDSWQMASLDQTVCSPRFVASDLQQGEAYCYRVRAVNKYGVSEPSEPSPPISLAAPRALPVPPHGVLAIEDTDSSVLLKWSEGKGSEDLLGYYLYYCPTGTSDWTTVNNKPTANTSFTVHGLRKNKEYVFRVKSVNREGNSEYSEESAPILVRPAIRLPSTPSCLALLNCTGTEMVIGWKAPKSSGGDSVKGYYLDQMDTAFRRWGEVNVTPVKERIHKVCGLAEGHYYQFRAMAVNMAGVGKPSEPSQPFLCEEWTMPEPGCPYDLEFREVRENSLILLWEGPLYQGRSPVTGYLVEIMEEGGGRGLGLGHSGASHRHQPEGVGVPSLPSEPITAQTKPGTKDIEIGVDNDGFIFMAFESQEGDEFTWAKNYKDTIDPERATVENKDNKSTLTFSDASEEDLGLYTAAVTESPQDSASYDFTAEVIALVSPWAVEVQETGGVRFWLQTEPLSAGAELHLVFNDREISSTPARKINFDKAAGLVEVLIENLALEDEGSYTAQLRDGRAKNQFTLVFVDEKFRQALALSQAKRADLKRKAGPYFLEYLSWTVTENCEVIIKCTVTNVSKDTTLKWFKDGAEIKDFEHDQQSGHCTFIVEQMTEEEAGVYRAVVSDSRGEDVSTLKLLDKELEKLQQQLCRQGGLSASPLKLQPTAEGFRLYCSLKLYLSYMTTAWSFREKRIDQEARSRPGSSVQKVWIDVLGPTESDKGKYLLEMFDGLETHKRTMDLSGQAFEDAMLEYQRLKQAAIAERNRAKVTRGLPDVVAIMEHKSLCLTCHAEGDPAPEMSWLKNGREVVAGAQFTIASDRQATTLTIHGVKAEDSGLYSLRVSNRHGSDTVHVTVSVYRRGELPRADAVEL
ncbi:hypothetical protein COCON_G00018790 [Conger conger]|uniref:Myomesin 3 n=1 Tax=Conger conger TaxID=82655 RepID=A0A9Q1E414_CONCO|nr:hypothetical protein COCON_G00018790 [Conger conger]